METTTEWKKPIDIEIKTGNIREGEIRRQIQTTNQALQKFFPDTIAPFIEDKDVKRIVLRNSTRFGRIFREERNTLGHSLANTETHLLTDNLDQGVDFRKWQDTL